jgi:hypothetical protein
VLTQRTDTTFPAHTPPLPNIYPYPVQLGAAVAAWFSADIGTVLSGSAVTSWVGRSANTIQLSNAGSPVAVNSIANGQNGLPFLQHANIAGADNAANLAYLGTPASVPALDLDWNVPQTIVVALRLGQFAGTEGQHALFLYGPSNVTAGLMLTTPTSAGAQGWSLRAQAVSGTLMTRNYGNLTVTPVGTTYSVIVTYDGSGTAAGFTFYVNGYVPPSGLGVSGGPITSTWLASTRLLRLFGANTIATPDQIFEFLVLNVALTPAQCVSMDKYLNQKWALHN